MNDHNDSVKIVFATYESTHISRSCCSITRRSRQRGIEKYDNTQHKAQGHLGELNKGMQTLFGSVLRQCSTLSKDCYTSPTQNKLKPQRWCALDHDLEELLIPRKLSISPSESWLTIKYWVPSLDLNHGQGIGIDLVNPKMYDCPPVEGSQVFEEDGAAINYKIDKIECKNVLKIRRRKMNRHKYKKLLKRTKFLRRRVKEGRRRRKQIKFERDLKRIWKKAGLKKPPGGWQAPKIYIKRYDGKSE